MATKTRLSNKRWGAQVPYDPEVAEALRVLKDDGYLLGFYLGKALREKLERDGRLPVKK